jgi:DUF1680 family protein
VDRWLRNHFAEAQLTSAEWVYRMAASQERMALKPNECADRAVERNLGGFAGWAAINDWVVRHQSHRFGIMHCCTGNAARAMYYVWENMVRCDQGALQVNLLMNRASPWADVYSSIPYAGRVDLKLKKPCRSALLRVPEWIKSPNGEVTCTVNGQPRNFACSGRYIKLESLAPGDRVSMAFPISERIEKVTMMGVEYTLVLRGSTVVAIDPAGEICPLYQREKYRQLLLPGQVPLREVNRFVSSETIAW